MENNKFYEYSKELQLSYMLLEQLYGIKKLDPEFLMPNSIEETKQRLVKAYKGLVQYLKADEIEKHKSPLVELIGCYEGVKSKEEFIKLLNNNKQNLFK